MALPQHSELVMADPLSKAALRAGESSLGACWAQFAPCIVCVQLCTVQCVSATHTVGLVTSALPTVRQAVGVSFALVFCMCLCSSA